MQDLPDQYQPLKQQVDVFYSIRNTPVKDGYWRKIRIVGFQFAKWKAEEFEDEQVVLKIIGYDKRLKTHIVFIQTRPGWRNKKGVVTKIQLASQFRIGDYIGDTEIPF